MKQVLIAIFATIFLGLLGCETYANEIDTLIVVAQGPRDSHPLRGYEIEFFADGMIRRIRQFRLSGEVDLYQWSTSAELRTYVSEYVTEKEENRIVQYQVISPEERKAVSTFEMSDKGRVDFYYHERKMEYAIEYEDINLFLKDGSGQILQSVTYGENEITLFSPTVNYREISRTTQSELKGFRIIQDNTTLEAKVSYDGKNLYSIAVPTSYGEVPYDVKVTLLVPSIDSFSQDAAVLNRFLTFVINTRESTYLLPFVSRRLVP